MTQLQFLLLSGNDFTGTVPSTLCSFMSLKRLSLWSANQTASAYANAGIVCTRSCLFAKMSYIPALPQCPLTVVSPSTQRGLCAFIAATTVATLPGYSSWECNSYGELTTQPCITSIIQWPGISSCSSTGDVLGIAIHNALLSGTIPPQLGSMTALQSLDLDSCRLFGETILNEFTRV